MNFSCDQCGKAYAIADEKVRGRAFKVTCKACGHAIVVRPGAPPASPARAAPAPGRAPAPAAAPPDPRPPRAPTPHPSLSPLARGEGEAERAFSDLFAEATPPVEPPAPRPPPAEVAGPARDPFDLRETVPSRPGLTDTELAWLDGDPSAAQHGAEARAAVAAAAQPRSRRTALLAAALALVAAGAGGFAGWRWWSGRSSRPAAPSAAVPAPVPAPPAPAPEALAAAAPAPAPEPPEPAPEAALAPPPAAEPSAPGRPARVKAEYVATGRPAADREARALSIARKDRKLLDLLDRKDDAAPAGAVSKVSLDTGRTALDQAALEQTFADARPALGACVTKAVKRDPKLRVDDRRATMVVTIQPSGVVSSAWVAEAELERTALGRCLAATTRRLVFPAFQGSAIDVSIPLALSAIR